MTNRRNFLKQAGIAGLGIAAMPSWANGMSLDHELISHRPPLSERKFVSQVVDAKIESMKKIVKDKELAWMFENCFPNTLDTTVRFSEKNGKPDTFVITGDINAMWLRDSTAQVWPYLPMVKQDPELKKLIQGVINRQVWCIGIDPYANAFNEGPEHSEWFTDVTAMKAELHERKWEIDSLCYPIRLAYHYWKNTGDTSCFNADWLNAMKLVVKTFREQQRKKDRGPYSFMRNTTTNTDTMPGYGWGNPIKPTGLICSGFRPSDDTTTFLFLIPSNYFAMVSLHQLAEMSRKIAGDQEFAAECSSFAKEIDGALKKYAVHNHPEFGEILAFEVDGFGNQLLMDDSNIPSLLALPYLEGLKQTDPLYVRTRKFILSKSNPFFFKGKYAEGIGGPHVGVDYIWPMSIIMRVITSNDEAEIASGLRMLKRTHAGTGFMHESFLKDNPDKFTRKWFAWANTLFGEMMLKVAEHHPNLLNREY